MTADRKRKLQDVQSGLTLLGLCPLLVHIWEKNGAPLRVLLADVPGVPERLRPDLPARVHTLTLTLKQTHQTQLAHY